MIIDSSNGYLIDSIIDYYHTPDILNNLILNQRYNYNILIEIDDLIKKDSNGSDENN